MLLFSLYSSGVADKEFFFGDMTEVHHAEHFYVTAIDVAVLAKRSAAHCTLHPAQWNDSVLQISSVAVKSPEWGNPNFSYLWLAHQTFIQPFIHLFTFSMYRYLREVAGAVCTCLHHQVSGLVLDLHLCL